MKKNFLFATLAVLLAGFWFGGASLAQSSGGGGGGGSSKTTTCVAEINGVGCHTLSEALESAQNGDTVTLINNINTNSEISINKKIILDLNGHSIINSGAEYAIKVVANGDLTIKDTDGDGKVRFYDETAAGTAIMGVKDSNITIEGGEYRGAFAVSVQEGTATINGGKFAGIANGNVATIHAYGGGTITINDGIFNGQPGEDVLEGANKEGKVLYAGANANICENPEYFDGNGHSDNPVYQPGYIIVNGGNFVGRLSLSNASSENYKIRGGTFDRKTVVKLTCSTCVNKEYTVCTNGNLNDITDGGYVFKEIVEGSKYIVEYDPVAEVYNGETKKGGYSTLTGAIIAANNGDTVKLNKNINTSISINKNITLDLSGYSITSSDSDAISNYGTLTILNGTVKTTAKNKGAIVNYPGGEITIGDINKKEETLVNVSSENNEYARYAIKNMGTMIVNSAYITKASSSASIIANGWYGNAGNDRNVVYPSNCSNTANLTFNGGTVEGPAGESLNVIKNDDCGVLIINDGTFTSNTDLSVDTVAPVIQNWHIATVNSGIFQSLKGVAITNGYLGIEDKGEIEVNGGTFIPTQSLLGLNGGATEGGKVVLKNGIFGGIISKPENKYDVQIQGGIFENKPDINYILDSYSVYKNNDGKYVVTTTAAAEQGAAEANVTPDPIVAAETTFTTGATENFSAEIPAEDSSKAGVVEQKLPDVAGDNATYTLIVDTKEEIQKVAESGDTTTTMTGVKESELRSSTNKVLEIKGGAEVYIKRADGTSTGRNTESVEFTEPVAIPIFVGTELSGQSVFVQSKHATGEAFGITGLVKDGTSCSSSNAVTSAPSIPVGANGYAIAYTCKASTFVAYTEVANPAQTPSGSSSGSSGGGGGGSSSYSCKNLPANAVANNTSKPKKNTDYSYSTDTSAVCTFQCKSGYTRNEKDAKCEKSDTEATTGDTAKLDETKTDENKADNNEGNKDGNATAVNGYSQEFIDAYEFAFKNGITTMPSIQEADMEGTLTRIAMAKMLSQYAINVLGKKPANIVVPNFPDVSAELDEQYNNGVALAYQLGIMGINIENFRPNDLVTRAEFGTALSRLLYGTADGEGAYYETHLQKLMGEKIITNDNPDLQELRGYVMIMLMRSANK